MIIRNDASRSKWPRHFDKLSDRARPPDLGLILGVEENAAQPHFPPLPTLKHLTFTERSRGEH
ncbi:hypothetical protein Ataiwa_26430 [Algoriphagus taiwanensis]|uniref:Uncharacterized protein n=1 Tax=Algoriphagus taiwanensis TaxID=1445656 RepID=A0ABQ6Q2L8_9BACT|nr:hypothetical protein Ataiwa_26430 [Algoriphagus taiwanensis]